MAVTSFFLVIFDGEQEQSRRAGWIYLIAAPAYLSIDLQCPLPWWWVAMDSASSLLLGEDVLSPDLDLAIVGLFILDFLWAVRRDGGWRPVLRARWWELPSMIPLTGGMIASMNGIAMVRGVRLLRLVRVVRLLRVFSVALRSRRVAQAPRAPKRSRSSRCRILPVAVRGISSSAMKRMARGHL